MTRPEKQQEVRWVGDRSHGFERISLASGAFSDVKAALHRMEFPAEDESTGAICELCWHGPGRASGSLAMQHHVTSCKNARCV